MSSFCLLVSVSEHLYIHAQRHTELNTHKRVRLAAAQVAMCFNLHFWMVSISILNSNSTFMLISLPFLFWMTLSSPGQAANYSSKRCWLLRLQTCLMWITPSDWAQDKLQWIFFCSAVRAGPGGFILFISLTTNQKLPFARPPLACQSLPSGYRLERDKRGRRAEKEREDKTGQGGGGTRKWLINTGMGC